MRFEDIVVEVFRQFPSDFHLKGYPEYPDSGDLVHKPLYEYKKKGVLNAGNKMFSFTEKGLVAMEKMRNAISGKKISSGNRLTRDIQKEINRIYKTYSFGKFCDSSVDFQPLDTDFYDYIGATVRMSKNDFIGRITTINDMIQGISQNKEKQYQRLVEFHEIMMDRFQSIVDFKKQTK